MSEMDPDPTGRVDDETEEQLDSSTTEGPAAEGDYDPAQGSPDSGVHVTDDD